MNREPDANFTLVICTPIHLYGENVERHFLRMY